MEDRMYTVHVRENTDRPLIVAEIGVWVGDNARHLMGLNLDRLFLIDPYKAYKRHDQKEVDEAMGIALPKIASHPNAYKTSFIRMESVEAAKLFADGYFDYIYIDGDHTLAGASEDLEAWWPKVKAGGYFAGHDYSSSVGVMRAVDAFCEERGQVVRTWAPPRTGDGPMHLADWLIEKAG